MARRKQQYDMDRVYKVTFKDAGNGLRYVNIAAMNFALVVELFQATGWPAYNITAIEKTDQTVYYGRIA